MSSLNHLIAEKQTITMYGIPNCDSVKRARAALAQHNVEYVFHDISKNPIPANSLSAWCKALGVPALLNRKSTSWRALSKIDQESVGDCASACALLLQHPKLIKRPLVEWPNGPTVGLDTFLERLYKVSHITVPPPL